MFLSMNREKSEAIFSSIILYAKKYYLLKFLYMQDTFHGGPLLRRQQHHNVPCVFYKGWGEKEPFSLRNLRMTTEQVCAKTPSKISTYEILGPEMILLNNYVSLKDQVFILRG